MKKNYTIFLVWKLLLLLLVSGSIANAQSSALQLYVKAYDCTTGFTTFETSGGDGSPIIFTAPGIIRSSLSSTAGVVEQGLRNDPKPLTITAIQNGQAMASATFDFSAYCRENLAPKLIKPIPDQTILVNKSLWPGGLIDIGSYFQKPGGSKSFRPVMDVRITGLPPGMWKEGYSTESSTLAYLAGTPTVTGVFNVTVVAYVSNDPREFSTTTTFTITAVNQPTSPAPGGALTILAPTYDCGSGAIAFNTSGGDGSPITYTAPGVTRYSPTISTGYVEWELRNDPKAITIQATQSGYTTSYTFDFKAYCTTPPVVVPPTTGALTLLAPTYDCASGAIRFNTSGGDGTAIELSSPGITGWTTNPDQFVDKDSRTANDVQPFTLTARQSGRVVTYTWDLKAACGRSARVAAVEATGKLKMRVLGNPVSTEAVVEVTGIEGQRLQFQLVNSRGAILETRSVETAKSVEQQTFDVGRHTATMLLLRAVAGPQSETIKLLKAN
ncbi:hypothetical protein [Spirosoma sp. KUDC1026]|uniref:hypothetical protein n=1 Tax=Spirosoma sp. KUDC1026 TaxID=2745947 RepID=UPI00159BC285|nr:hypothetical protein [Spirosoma sp. KUDC1026]QKZ12171.1 hypothetical protein HU175_05825 [Spirosoma sp. KUDC1026]